MQDRLALVTHNVVAMRAAPEGGSEQVSQTILGEIVVWLAEQDDQVQVRTADGYEGWIWRGNVRELGDIGDSVFGVWCLAKGVEEFASLVESDRVNSTPWPFVAESQVGGTPQVRYISSGIVNLYAEMDEPLSLITKLVMGTWLQVIDIVPDTSVPMLKVTVPFNALPLVGEVANPASLPSTLYPLPTALITGYVKTADTLPASAYGYQGVFSGRAVCALAQRFIGTPYLWGGTTPFGFDCSGYVQFVYKLHNIVLPRDAYMQAQSALGVVLAADTAPTAGDLVFFCGRSDPRKRGITHVGMALDAERFIHAYGKQGVVITRFDDPACRANYTVVSGWRYQEPSRLNELRSH